MKHTVLHPTEKTSPETSSEVAFELRGVSKHYGQVTAVDSVDLVVRHGEFLTLLGPSGSGKTTILRMIAGFTDISSGDIFIRGRNVSSLSPAEREIGMVFQNYALFPHLTAFKNVAYPLRMRKWSRQRIEKTVSEMLSLVGLSGKEGRLPRELSGGQQQRVALARALAFDPALLLMDEPLGALDRELRIRMAGELRRIHNDLGTTFVYVTHDREEALTLSDRICIMHEGIVEAVGTPQELFDAPPSAFAASFFGGHNVIPVTCTQVADTVAEVSVFGQSFAVARSERLADTGPAQLVIPASSFQTLPGASGIRIDTVVRDNLYMGEGTQLRVECVGSDIELTAMMQGDFRGQQLNQELTLFATFDKLIAVP